MSDLLIDVGSTVIKWMETGSENVKISFVPFPEKINLPEPFYEIPLRAITDELEEIIFNNNKSKRIFLSVQMHGYVLLNSVGKPITEYISWMDKRAVLSAHKIYLPPESGVRLKENMPRAGILAMEDLFPNFMSMAAEFCTLGSYLCKKWTGQNETHITDATPSGFFNINGEIIGNKKYNYPKACMDVRSVGLVGGKTLFVPVGDQQCAVFGSGANENEYVLNLGTAGQLCVISDEFLVGEFESRPYFGGKTLCTVTNLPGGKVLEDNQCVDQIMESQYVAALTKLPKRNRIRAIGGTSRKYFESIQRIFNKIGLPVSVTKQEDGLNGLKKISERIK